MWGKGLHVVGKGALFLVKKKEHILSFSDGQFLYVHSFELHFHIRTVIYLPNIYCRYLILYILSEPKLRYKSFRGALHYRRELDCIKTRSRACPLNGVCSDTKEISKEIIIINRPLEEGEVNWAAEKSLKGCTKNFMRQTLICAEKVAGIRCIILLANKQQTFLCKQIRMQRTGGGEEIVGE